MAKPDPSRHAPQEIDAYLAELPENKRHTLEQLRRIIRETAPDCTERVSYRIPIFRLRTDLVAMSAAKAHCSLHVMSTQLLKDMAEALADYKVSGATVQFSPDEPLPEAIIVKIVQERIKEQQKTTE